MIKTFAGSQTVQQLWQTKAIFRHKQNIMRILFFDNSINIFPVHYFLVISVRFGLKRSNSVYTTVPSQNYN